MRPSPDVPSHLRLNVHRSRVAIIRDGDVRLGTRCDAHTEAVLNDRDPKGEEYDPALFKKLSDPTITRRTARK